MRISAVLLILLAIGLAGYAVWQMLASMNKDPDRPPVNLRYPMYAGVASVLLAIIAVVIMVMHTWEAIRQ
ncbi:MAG TPA: hypothetical protein VL282_19555 [Tepidisphaeraceae bacterium]|jgi:hypothetical protein|nr:hypothetical protein [Tepidisphaeraceae bacterium]